ncbi:MAG TPA: methylthioribulose 1-phosphate dehydratase [Polyangiaceae bacterium]|jgi:methylthioribulose-1-phosphate dehydratase|nr:methylthioribulose 1-phosphate dehydratase [Polyangiaceae bacterium]
MNESSPRALIVELCRVFYAQGWVSGTGGGVSVRDGGRVFVAPSGVQKERLRESDIYVLDESGSVLERPEDVAFTPSACTPLFFNAYRLRGAGAVIHSHSMHAMLATLTARDAFECTELEMIKGITGHGYHDRLQVPIIENTAYERDLADSMARAIEANPRSYAVLVRRHGVYIWGKDWVEAKTHAECYHYLFEAAVRMAALGVDARKASEPALGVLEGGKR